MISGFLREADEMCVLLGNYHYTMHNIPEERGSASVPLALLPGIHVQSYPRLTCERRKSSKIYKSLTEHVTLLRLVRDSDAPTDNSLTLWPWNWTFK